MLDWMALDEREILLCCSLFAFSTVRVYDFPRARVETSAPLPACHVQNRLRTRHAHTRARVEF